MTGLYAASCGNSYSTSGAPSSSTCDHRTGFGLEDSLLCATCSQEHSYAFTHTATCLYTQLHTPKQVLRAPKQVLHTPKQLLHAHVQATAIALTNNPHQHADKCSASTTPTAVKTQSNTPNPTPTRISG